MADIQTLDFTERRGKAIQGDLYLPQTDAPAPLVIAIHGGGWKGGARDGYAHWGPWLAARGIALFSIDYTLATPGRPSFPDAVEDVLAAIHFVTAHAAQHGIDPARLALMGDSAGAQLAALVALAPPGDLKITGHDDVRGAIRAVVGIYGVYDMLAQWQHDQVARPRDQITEHFLGLPPAENRRLFFDTSPISYATTANAKVAFYLAYGDEDDIVNRAQSDAFLIALKQANVFVRRTVIPGAGHFWMKDPIEEQGGVPGQIAAPLLRFLMEKL